MSFGSWLKDVGKGLLSGGIVGAVSAGISSASKNKNNSDSSSADVPVSEKTSSSNAQKMLVPILQAGTSLAGSLLSDRSSRLISNANIGYQKAYNQAIWDREDTAYQRAAQDLRLAGLSKTLATGAAPTGGSTAAPQISYDPNTTFGNALSATNLLLESFKAQSQINKVDSEIANIDADTANKTVQNDILEAEAYCKGIEATHADEIARLNIKEKLSKLALNEKNIEFVSQNIEKVARDIVLADKQAEKLDVDTKNAILEYTKTQLEIEIAQFDFDYYTAQGFTSKGPQTKGGKYVSDSSGFINAVGRTFKNSLSKLGSKLSFTNWR